MTGQTSAMSKREKARSERLLKRRRLAEAARQQAARAGETFTAIRGTERRLP